MTAQTKRTYNVSAETIARVRDLAGRVGTAPSQDGVVELAVEHLYQEVRDQEEARLWAKASNEPEFRSEMRTIAIECDDLESWPQ
jgi:hypothetical protein